LRRGAIAAALEAERTGRSRRVDAQLDLVEEHDGGPDSWKPPAEVVAVVRVGTRVRATCWQGLGALEDAVEVQLRFDGHAVLAFDVELRDVHGVGRQRTGQ